VLGAIFIALAWVLTQTHWVVTAALLIVAAAVETWLLIRFTAKLAGPACFCALA
jgi:hypothetical protein